MSISHTLRQSLIEAAPVDKKTAVAELTRPTFLYGKQKKIGRKLVIDRIVTRYDAVIEDTSTLKKFASFIIYGGNNDVEVNMWFNPFVFDLRLVIDNKAYHFGSIAKHQTDKVLDLLKLFEGGREDKAYIIRALRGKAYSVVVEALK